MGVILCGGSTAWIFVWRVGDRWEPVASSVIFPGKVDMKKNIPQEAYFLNCITLPVGMAGFSVVYFISLFLSAGRLRPKVNALYLKVALEGMGILWKAAKIKNYRRTTTGIIYGYILIILKTLNW